MHKDIGKRVTWKYGNESGTGTLMAVDCDGTTAPHIVQREDGMGWTIYGSGAISKYVAARAQGVKDGTPNLFWIESYELIEQPMRTIDDCVAGDVLVDRDGDYEVVHERLGKVVFTGYYSHDIEEAKQSTDCYEYTLERLKSDGYSLYSPEERTADDVLATLSDSDKEILKKAMK